MSPIREFRELSGVDGGAGGVGCNLRASRQYSGLRPITERGVRGDSAHILMDTMDTNQFWRTRVTRPLVVAALALAVPLSGVFLAGPAIAGTGGTSETPPFNECPAVGNDSSCGVRRRAAVLLA